jgi:hypothetical protein
MRLVKMSYVPNTIRNTNSQSRFVAPQTQIWGEKSKSPMELSQGEERRGKKEREEKERERGGLPYFTQESRRSIWRN